MKIAGIIMLMFFLLPSPSYAQTKISRLYLPVSDSVDIVVENDQSKMLVKDYLNSTKVELQPTSSTVQAYYPYGTGLNKEFQETTDKQFTGHRIIGDTDIYQAKARFYNAEIGLFIQPDSVGDGNRFEYVNDDPISYHDLNGRDGTSAVVREIKEILIGAFTHAKIPGANQDAFFCIKCTLGRAIGVFDGMGGAASGREASHVARDVIGRAIESASPRNEIDAKNIMYEAFMNANEAIRQRNLGGGGTTGTVVWATQKNEFIIGHVGDSRVSATTRGGLVHLTLDDSYYASVLSSQQAKVQQVRFANIENPGQLSSTEQIYWSNPNLGRHVLKQALSGDPINVSLGAFKPLRGGTLLISSDGIHDNLTDPMIYDTLMRGTDPVITARTLVEQAFRVSQSGGFRAKQDDLTAAVMYFR